MELFKEIFANVLSKEDVHVIFPKLKTDVDKIVELECYKALKKIKTIIEDDSLDDEECFMKIEKIIYVFESMGINCGNRHDFG